MMKLEQGIGSCSVDQPMTYNTPFATYATAGKKQSQSDTNDATRIMSTDQTETQRKSRLGYSPTEAQIGLKT